MSEGLTRVREIVEYWRGEAQRARESAEAALEQEDQARDATHTCEVPMEWVLFGHAVGQLFVLRQSIDPVSSAVVSVFPTLLDAQLAADQLVREYGWDDKDWHKDPERLTWWRGCMAKPDRSRIDIQGHYLIADWEGLRLVEHYDRRLIEKYERGSDDEGDDD
jgi:hypothetical protein